MIDYTCVDNEEEHWGIIALPTVESCSTMVYCGKVFVGDEAVMGESD